MSGIVRSVGMALMLGVMASAAQGQGNANAVVNSVIAKCVAVARNYPDQLGMSRSFDAYYNPATGTVENNAYLQGQQPALFEFNKCMAASGYPLGAPPKP